MADFFLICGMAGGGKTTLGKQLVKWNPNLLYFDVDEYYAIINGDECDRSHCFEVWIALYQDLHKAEIENRDVLLTTNALTVSQRQQFIEWFPSFKHHMIWVKSPFPQCLEGNKNRRRQVPEHLMREQWETQETPTSRENAWISIAEVIPNWKTGEYYVFNVLGRITDGLWFYTQAKEAIFDRPQP